MLMAILCIWNMHVFLGFYQRQRHPLYWTGKHLNRIISEQLERHSLAPYWSAEQKQRVLQLRWSAFQPSTLLFQFLSVLLLLPPYNQVKLKPGKKLVSGGDGEPKLDWKLYAWKGTAPLNVGTDNLIWVFRQDQQAVRQCAHPAIDRDRAHQL